MTMPGAGEGAGSKKMQTGSMAVGMGIRPLLPRIFCGLLAFAVCLVPDSVLSQQDTAAVEAQDAPAAAPLSDDALRKLVAPIALYPDDLLAVVLPASTNPLQIVQAQRFLEKHAKDKNLKPDDTWDPSVLALLNYPEIINKMNTDLEWTEDLGNAVIDQQEAVMDMIQQVRSEAHAAGYLESNDKQVVVQEKETIIIKSADPEIVYVPTYDPQVVYVQSYATYPPIYYSNPYPYYYYPGAYFWTGMFVGAAFSYGFDWNDSDIDINCCGGNNNNINIGGGDNINIGDGDRNRDRVDHRNADRFNADRQRVNGRDQMKWNGNKARQKQTNRQNRAKAAQGTLPARGNKAAGAGGSKLKNPAAGNTGQRRGDKSSMGNYRSNNRETTRSRDQGRQSMQSRNKRQNQMGNQSRNRQRSGAFGSYGGGSRTMMQSNRGGSSMRSSRGGGRGGGRR
jgi:hypothetical protein